MTNPEIIDQDEMTVTIKLPDGQVVKMSRSALPDFLKQLEFGVLQRGGQN